jgi:hypothetical protein
LEEKLLKETKIREEEGTGRGGERGERGRGGRGNAECFCLKECSSCKLN